MKLLAKKTIILIALGVLFSFNAYADSCTAPTQLEIKDFLFKLMKYHNDKASVKLEDLLSKNEFERIKDHENAFWETLNEIFSKQVRITLKSFPKDCDGFIGFTYITYSKDEEYSSESNFDLVIKKENDRLVIVEIQVAG